MLPAPIALQEVFADPDALVARVVDGAPYWNQARYLPAGRAGAATAPAGHPLARGDGTAPPVFRGDWAYHGALVEGVDELLDHPPFVAAARDLFAGEVVVPYVVHVNLTAPGPAIDAGHTDVPAFRGLDRRNAPGWLLLAMARSGLFDGWWLNTATAVSWFYRGLGGGFTYWPDGPDAPSRTETDLWNTAVVGDNDRMPHRVESVGSGSDLHLSAESVLRLTDGRRFQIVQGDDTVAELAPAELRISLSWKALVFADEADHARYRDGSDDIGLEQVRRTFVSALAATGSGLDDSIAIDDPALAEAISDAWPRRVPAASRVGRSADPG